MMDEPLHPFAYDEHHIEHLTAHEDLRHLVHEAFSPNLDWPMSNDYSSAKGPF